MRTVLVMTMIVALAACVALGWAATGLRHTDQLVAILQSYQQHALGASLALGIITMLMSVIFWTNDRENPISYGVAMLIIGLIAGAATCWTAYGRRSEVDLVDVAHAIRAHQFRVEHRLISDDYDIVIPVQIMGVETTMTGTRRPLSLNDLTDMDQVLRSEGSSVAMIATAQH